VYELIRQKAVRFMLVRGWRELLAKSGAYQQSLFEHTLCELDVLLQLLPILRLSNHCDLKPEEEQILIVSVIGHDVGKETKEFQDYIKDLTQDKALHIITELTKKVVPEICEALGFNNLQHCSHQIIENCINLHMSRNRTDANFILSVLQGSGRWKALADIVYDLDNFCSSRGLLAALNTLEQSNLSMHLKLAYHQVVIRGVSTVFLHKATVDSFIEQGWSPLIFFSEGTIYAASPARLRQKPAWNGISGSF
jgi:CRISPR type I-D-associated protein Csc3/Cas10d